MPSASDNPSERRLALEARMGEMASILAEVAEALTYFPGELQIGHDEVNGSRAPSLGVSMTINAREWPTIQEIEQLVANWRELSLIVGPNPGRRATGRVA